MLTGKTLRTLFLLSILVVGCSEEQVDSDNFSNYLNRFLTANSDAELAQTLAEYQTALDNYKSNGGTPPEIRGLVSSNPGEWNGHPGEIPSLASTRGASDESSIGDGASGPEDSGDGGVDVPGGAEGGAENPGLANNPGQDNGQGNIAGFFGQGPNEGLNCPIGQVACAQFGVWGCCVQELADVCYVTSNYGRTCPARRDNGFRICCSPNGLPVCAPDFLGERPIGWYCPPRGALGGQVGL